MRMRSVMGVGATLAAVAMMTACKPAEEASKPVEPTETSEPALVSTDIGEVHNAGVRYVLEGMRPGLSDAEAQRIIIDRGTDYCRDTGKCPWRWPPDRGPRWPYPTTTDAIVQASDGSPSWKMRLDQMLRAMEKAETLETFNAAADRALAAGGEPLTAEESRRLADAVAIGKASARMWAPVAMGGEGGFSGPWTEDAAAKIDWGDIAVADLVGCALGWETGCIGAGLISSAYAAYTKSRELPSGGT